jgi:hypothetical protein
MASDVTTEFTIKVKMQLRADAKPRTEDQDGSRFYDAG